jgi:hypothetical protein
MIVPNALENKKTNYLSLPFSKNLGLRCCYAYVKAVAKRLVWSI